MKTKLLIISFLFIVLNFYLNAQTQNNLDLINVLIDNSVARTDSLLGGKQTINLTVTTTQSLEILKPKILQAFNERGYLLKTSNAESGISVNYNLTSANVEYKNSYSDGFFGGIALERQITVNGSFTIIKLNHIIQPIGFAETRADTIKLDEIANLENRSIPFTQGQIPSQPLLSIFWEPIIVVGTLIVTVILLFTVRSK